MKRYVKELANDYMARYPETEERVMKLIHLYERCYIDELEVVREIMRSKELVERSVQNESSLVSR